MLGSQHRRAARSALIPTICTLDTACQTYLENRQRMSKGLPTVCTVYQATSHQAVELHKLVSVDPSVLRSA